MARQIALFVLVQLTALVSSQTDYSVYRQPEDFTNGVYDDLSRNPSNVCARNCDGRPKICYYKFDIQIYSTMGPACRNCSTNQADCFRNQCIPADGFHKSIITVNRRLHSLSIQVCLGDTVVVDVHNAMIGKHTTIHWHGHLQRDTPWMDGVSMITQCPITPGQTFRYKFKADSPGTHYWHDHAGLIKLDGVQGSMVVREIPKPDNNMHLYDYDLPSHSLLVADCKHNVTDAELPDERIDVHPKFTDSYLINGFGMYTGPQGTRDRMPLRDYQQAKVKTPLYTVNVMGRFRYRLRLVGGICLTCGVRFSIDQHRFTVIASDGEPVRPVVADYLNIFPGERYDIVVEMNQMVGTYWILLEGITGAKKLCELTYGVGLLKYQGSQYNLPSNNFMAFRRDPITVNAIEGGCNTPSQLCIHQLQSTKSTPSRIYNYMTNFRQLIQFGFHEYTGNDPFSGDSNLPYYQPLDGVLLRPVINNITFKEPSSPLLTQLSDNPANLFCDARCRSYLQSRTCQCIDPIKVMNNTVVDMIVIDTERMDGQHHPIHLHGCKMYVLETGIYNGSYDPSLQALMRKVENGGVRVNMPPMKDTIVIPNSGYAIVRFIADNPGFWILHCHFLVHHAQGMSTVLQIGDVNQFKLPPPRFPRCGNFYPD